MRLPLILFGLFAAALATPAAADMTITYAPDSPGGRGLVIEVDDAGRIRAENGPGQMLIMRDGDIYVVTPGEETPTVARIDDFLAVAEEGARAFRQSGFLRLPSPDTHYRLNDRGPQTVGSWPGTLLAIEQVGPHDPELDAQWVVSSDPALAEPGRIVLRVLDVMARLAHALVGDSPPEFMARLNEVRSRGALLRIVRQYRLESVGTDPVPASRFELPGPVLTREQLQARIPR